MSTGPNIDPVADWAESGIAALTGFLDGPPLIPPGRAATRARELSAFVASATSGVVRLDGARLLSERAAFTGHHRSGNVSAGGSCRVLPTADGWAAVSCARSDDPLLLGALVSAEIVGRWLREHTGTEMAERAELLGVAAGPIVAPAAMPPIPSAPRSVEGLLVVDFSALWAGPLCAHLLGLAGARVVKVETPWRPDGARRGNHEFYRLLHGGHESVVLDPNVPGERAALHDLVASADIVIEASRPRALAGFGLDADAVTGAGGTWVSITAHGRHCDRVGFGDDVAASAGLVAHDRGTPVFVGDAIADPLTGLTAAALAMSESGGRLWDVSMFAVVAGTLPDSDITVPPAYRIGDRWWVDTASDTVPIAEPAARAPFATAPESGRDTDAVLSGLGIRR